MVTEYKIINKNLMAVYNGSKYHKIMGNIFEIVKAECIAHSKERLKKYLPYISAEFCQDTLPDLESWRLAFSDDNPPEEIKFDERLEEFIKDIDFSKPYSAEIAEKIRKSFKIKDRMKSNVDADLIIMGELGELEEKEK